MIALHHSNNCLAVHTTTPSFPRPTLRKSPVAYLKYQLARVTGCRIPAFSFGYTTTDFERSTESSKVSSIAHFPRPQTISYSLCDSPSGLLAYMVDLLHSSEHSSSWPHEEVLTWTMLQWLPGPEAGLRWVRKAQESESELWDRYCAVPLGISQFNAVLDKPSPPGWATAVQKLDWVKRRRDAARFPAWERADSLVVDMREFFGDLASKGVLKTSSREEVSGKAPEATT